MLNCDHSKLLVSPASKLLSNGRVQALDNKTVRRENLVHLAATLDGGNMAAFADRVGTSAAHMSQIKTGKREMGDAIARRIEVALNKRRGWMDSPIFVQSEVTIEQVEIAQIMANLPAEHRDAVLAVARALNERHGQQGVAAPFAGVPKSASDVGIARTSEGARQTQKRRRRKGSQQ